MSGSVRRLASGLLAGLGIVAASALAVGGFIWVRPDLMLVERVEFVGAERAEVASLRHLSDIRNGSTIWTVDVERARLGVQKHPWVRSARARRVFPDAVRIEITERKPVALLRTDALYYIDETGEVFAKVDGHELDFPVVSGVDERLAGLHPDLPKLAIRDGLSLMDELDSRGLVFRDDVSELAFSSSRGFTLHTVDGARIRFGLDGRERQVDRLASLLERDVDLSMPILVDLAPKSVAIVRPLGDPKAGS